MNENMTVFLLHVYAKDLYQNKKLNIFNKTRLKQFGWLISGITLRLNLSVRNSYVSAEPKVNGLSSPY